MPKPASAIAEERLAEGFDLDRLWESTMRMPEGDTKEQPLRLLMTVFEVEQVAYAVIGGLAVQLYTEEPRTTKDIEVALASYTDLPAAALERAGFEHEQRFAHSDNWRPKAAPSPAPGPTIDQEWGALPGRCESRIAREMWPFLRRCRTKPA